jgi:branched-chain amino acid transport system ATP-binding protein
MLRVQDLGVSYGAIRAVRGIDLDVTRGEIVAILGANGAGKSSTLMALVGLVRAERGRIELDGEAVHGLPTEQIVRRGMTLTPEGRRVFPNLSVADNLVLGGFCEPDRGQRARRWEEALELFPVLRERLAQAAGTLSGGEQQQLAIARSLMSGPRLLLLDEPSLGLAPQVVDAIFDLIAALRDRGLTILLVEQNVDRALEIADRAYVFANGHVALAGPSADLLRSDGVARAYLGLSGD